ncbi:MAG: hypothetical protein RLZZ626_493 [Actinomycetota bacterium]
MAENLNDTVTAELERIQNLPIDERVAAFAALRDLLEAALQDLDSVASDA